MAKTQGARTAAPPRQAAAPANNNRPNRDTVAELLDDDETELITADAIALEAITKSEVMMQLDAAHRWPRSIARFREEAAQLATMTKETAKSCIYSLPTRKPGEKPIVGPSVRLAEMCATSWGNLHIGVRILDTGERDVTAQAQAWDLEKNLRLGVEVKRGIRTRDGKRFGDDMIRVTSMAALAIARRNAILSIIPRALTNEIYAKAEAVATGSADGTFEQERDAVLGVFVNKWKVPLERVLARLQIASVAELGQEELAILIGIGGSIKRKEVALEDAFPSPQAAQPRERSSGAVLDGFVAQHKARKQQADEPAPAPQVVLDALMNIDNDWTAEHLALVEGWTAAQRAEAHAWAVAYDSPSEVDDADLPERPAFTKLGRQPGEDG